MLPLLFNFQNFCFRYREKNHFNDRNDDETTRLVTRIFRTKLVGRRGTAITFISSVNECEPKSNGVSDGFRLFDGACDGE